MMRRLDIDLIALQHNLARVRHYAPKAKVLAMIKANGYGHGLLSVAKALRSAEGFGVADASEAICLRQAGFDQVIVVMRGFHNQEELMAFAEYDLTAVIHHHSQIELLKQCKLKQAIGVWLKMDTGMHRLGFSVADYKEAYIELQASDQVKKPLCMLTHLADAEIIDPTSTARQWMNFELTLAALPVIGHCERSVVNSAGILGYPEIEAEWVRPGLMLYGASPTERPASDYGLQPVMTITSEVVSIQSLPCGAAIGYGGTFVCPKPMRIGVVAYGYGDGYPRFAPTGTPVLINGQYLPLVGRVSMDLLTVDLTSAVDVTIGSSVTLWGKGLAVERVAKAAETIPYELLCHVQRHRLVTTGVGDDCCTRDNLFPVA